MGEFKQLGFLKQHCFFLGSMPNPLYLKKMESSCPIFFSSNRIIPVCFQSQSTLNGVRNHSDTYSIWPKRYKPKGDGIKNKFVKSNLVSVCLFPASSVPRPFLYTSQIDLQRDSKIRLVGCNTVDSLRAWFLPLSSSSAVISHSCQMQENIDFQRFFFFLTATEWTASICTKRSLPQNSWRWKSLSELMHIVFNERSRCALMLELGYIKLNILPWISISPHRDSTSQSHQSLRCIYLMFCNKTASWKTFHPSICHRETIQWV